MSSNQYSDGVDAIRRMAITYKNIVGVADALEKVGSIEQCRDEAESALATARMALDAFKVKAADESADIDFQLAAKRKELAEIAEVAMAEAKSQADAVMQTATNTANRMIADAERVTELEQKRQIEALKVAKEAIGPLKKQAEALSTEVAELSETVAALTAQKTNLETEIASIKAKFA